ALGVLALDALGAAAFAQPGAKLLQLGGERAQPSGHLARLGGGAHQRALPNHSRMYSIAAEVGVPGPNRRPLPRSSSVAASPSGMIPPPVRSTWSAPASSSSAFARGKSVMCAPDSTDIATTSTSS